MRRSIGWVLVLSAVAYADPPPEPVAPALPPVTTPIGGPSARDANDAPPAPIVPVAAPSCSPAFYADPSLLVGAFGSSGAAGVLNRIGIGLLVRPCESPWRAHLGGTLFAANFGAGYGIEAELAYRVGGDSRLGVHVALEHVLDHVNMASVDVRYHFADAIWVQVGGYDAGGAIGYARPTRGFAAGLGIEGKPGVVLSAIEISAVTTLFGMFLYVCSTGGCGD